MNGISKIMAILVVAIIGCVGAFAYVMVVHPGTPSYPPEPVEVHYDVAMEECEVEVGGQMFFTRVTITFDRDVDGSKVSCYIGVTPPFYYPGLIYSTLESSSPDNLVYLVTKGEIRGVDLVSGRYTFVEGIPPL